MLNNGYLTIAPSLFDRVESDVQLDYDENGVTKGRKLKDLCDNDALKDIDSAISVVASAGKVGSNWVLLGRFFVLESRL